MPSSPKIKPVTKSALRAAEADLRAFRHDVTVLKRKGLLDKLYDGRSVKPSKYLVSQIKRFKNVLSGDAVTAKVSRANAKYYKGRGYDVKKGRVVVPTSNNEKVYSSHGDFHVKFSGSGGSITIQDLRLSKTDVVQWIKDLRANKFKLKNNETLSFQMYGHNSLSSPFADKYKVGMKDGKPVYAKHYKTAQEQMADYLEFYPAFEVAELTGDPQANKNWIDGIVILKIKRDKNGNTPIPKPDISRHTMDADRLNERNERRRHARIRKLADLSNAEYNEYADERARSEKARRAAMSKDQKERYKSEARKRAAQSRARKAKGHE